MTRTFSGVVLLMAGLAAVSLSQREKTIFDQPRSPLTGPLVRVRCDGTGGKGIVVRISLPKVPRYPQGAPVAVHVTPGTLLGGVDEFPFTLTDFGFIELRFLWPGDKSKPQSDGTIWESGGPARRGPFSDTTALRAAASVLAFAVGRTTTIDGRKLQDYVVGTQALSGDTGVIGWSQGGNAAAAAMAVYGNQLPQLQWYASWESPFGSGTLDGEFGTYSQPNPFYDSERSTLDLSNLRYGKDLPVKAWSGDVPEGAENLQGSLYLDGNQNGRFDKDSDFLFSGVFRRGPAPNVFYSPELTRAARDRKVFPDEWPAHIASVEESTQFWRLQDGVSQIDGIRKNIPGLAVIVQASTEDHVSTAADHRHVQIQYDGFRSAGVRWIRLNPDAHYVDWVMGRNRLRIIQNEAGKKFERSAILQTLEPSPAEGGPDTAVAIAATACELADRVTKKNWDPTLLGVLFPNAPRSSANSNAVRR